jgi:hypothetical protein
MIAFAQDGLRGKALRTMTHAHPWRVTGSPTALVQSQSRQKPVAIHATILFTLTMKV